MPALLEPHTALTVSEAADGVPVTPGHLYVIPPGAYLSAGDGVLHLSAPQGAQRGPHAVRFPAPIARPQYGERAACVVLSGTGTDGSDGLRAIKARGGVVAVQDPAEAAYDGMPRSAIETGLADFVLPLAEDPAAPVGPPHPTAERAGRGRSADLAPSRCPRAMQTSSTLLRVETGHDFAHLQTGTLERRIGRRMALAGLRPNDHGPLPCHAAGRSASNWMPWRRTC